MKKTLIATLIALTTATAQAAPSVSGYVVSSGPTIGQAYRNGYNNGYEAGKQKGYDNVKRAVFFTTAVVFTGFVIYKIGQNSRWTATENGVTYRF